MAAVSLKKSILHSWSMFLFETKHETAKEKLRYLVHGQLWCNNKKGIYFGANKRAKAV